eukprot:COSAG05_NODE_10766_length_547_cov_1.363839_1_plen_131_part_10
MLIVFPLPPSTECRTAQCLSNARPSALSESVTGSRPRSIWLPTRYTPLGPAGVEGKVEAQVRDSESGRVDLMGADQLHTRGSDALLQRVNTTIHTHTHTHTHAALPTNVPWHRVLRSEQCVHVVPQARMYD